MLEHASGIGNIFADGVNALRVSNVVRILHGGSQSKLVKCNDGCLYILKLHPSPQGPNALANEWLGSTVARGLGLPVPIFSKVLVDGATIKHNELLVLETEWGRTIPSVGIHFVSKMVGDSHGRRRPQSYLTLKERSNVYRFKGGIDMWLLDLWADHRDWRDAVVVRGDGTEADQMFYIDHGHLFGGPLWLPISSGTHEARYGLSQARSLWSKTLIEHAVINFQEKAPDLLNLAVATLPKTWYTGNLESLLSLFSRRLQNLKRLALGYS